MTDGLLRGRRILTTRDTPGRLDELLRAVGADPIHVPLIEIGPPDDGGIALGEALGHVDRYDWIVVTSRHGAERVAGAVRPGTRLAVVGAATAAVLRDLTGREPDVQPVRQTAAELAAAMPEPGAERRVLAALGDLAADTLADGLRARGYDVDVVVAYRTHVRRPAEPELERLRSGEVLTLASGSAARSWAAAIGTWTPAHVVAIGPTTAAVAREVGLPVTAVAEEHSLEGLVDAVHRSVAGHPS